jgi:hypothetical protein
VQQKAAKKQKTAIWDDREVESRRGAAIYEKKDKKVNNDEKCEKIVICNYFE